MSDDSRLPPGNFAIGVVAIAATYTYFLLFAEFAFLKLLAGRAVDLHVALGALGGGGVIGSFVAAGAFRRARFRLQLVVVQLACAVTAAVAPAITSPGAISALAFGVGFSLGAATVTLSGGLQALLGRARLGTGVGLGTGLAYALSNLPAIFSASPGWQAEISAAAMLVAAATLGAARPALREENLAAAAGPAWRWAVVFLALVAMDSAAFAIIQDTPAPQLPTWHGAAHLWGNAAIHLVAALLAGWLLDAGAIRSVAVGAWLLLAFACIALGRPQPPAGLGFVYAAGVSLYSAALVYFPASTARPWVAAAVFAVAGWIGSALGLGVAQDLHRIPPWIVLAAGGAIALALGARPRRSLKLGTLLLAGWCAARPSARADEALSAQEAAGRETYIAEGCINCHSQYVRPHLAPDVERWGPAVPLAEIMAGTPPLPGNRRQGPDLLNVGLRRSAEWHRLHLRDPRALNPASRMPAYAQLFRAGDPRGETLVAYLASLGRERVEERAAFIAAWSPAPVAPLPPAAAARLFRQLCSACHGANGAGDGPLAARLSLAPPNWAARAPWRLADAGPVALARTIKFGLMGTPMPGHEALADDAIIALARHVRLLHGELPP